MRRAGWGRMRSSVGTKEVSRMRKLASKVGCGLAAAWLAIPCTGLAAEIADGVNLAGDLRVRHESVRPNATLGGDDVDRARMRLRIGLDAKLDENWSVGARLATGGSPTSTNQDLDVLNDDAPLYVDRAFARWHGLDGKLQILAGRTANPYASSMMLWDSDYNPDGVSAKLTLGEGTRYWMTLGHHTLGQNATGSYGGAYTAIQPGASFKAGETDIDVAVAYYGFVNAGGVDDVAADGEYALLDVRAAAKMKFGSLPASCWIDAVTNLDADEDGSAYGVGLSFGSTREKGGVKASLSYMSIPADALWIDLCDANFTSGLTDVDMHGLVLGASVGVGKGATFGATWYYKESLESDAVEEQLEVDLMLKF
jgi:hypothetical protein